MGIPRLFSDLQQFTNKVALASSDAHIDLKCIDSIVIDGPSLVYFVYYRLLEYSLSKTSQYVATLPSYEEISLGVNHILSEIESRGCKAKKIYFDGALPIQKRRIRWERLEKLRHQLVLCRNHWTRGFERHPNIGLPPIDYESAFWRFNSSGKVSALPVPPPFMIFSAIEYLQESGWSEIVQVVPGEADSYCAKDARDHGCGILSSDSDMAVYDLRQGCVVLTQSLAKKLDDEASENALIVAQSLWPASLIRQLNVTDLLRLAFERHLDPTVSLAIILQRTRDQKRLNEFSSEFKVFSAQYSVPEMGSVVDRIFSKPGFKLDTRLAEFLAQVLAGLGSDTSNEKRHVYLPMILEDPTREFAWAYGLELRTVAYSAIELLGSPEDTSADVSEFCRKGPRVAESPLDLLRDQSLESSVAKIWASLSLCASIFSTSKLSPLKWQCYALWRIQRQKSKAGKRQLSATQVRCQLGLDHKKSKISWEETHVDACVQAVLYSLRMLKQSTALFLNHCKGCHNELIQLSDGLKDLPNLVDLITRPMVDSVESSKELEEAMQYIMGTSNEVDKSGNSDEKAVEDLFPDPSRRRELLNVSLGKVLDEVQPWLQTGENSGKEYRKRSKRKGEVSIANPYEILERE